MDPKIQAKIDAIYKLAKASTSSVTKKEKQTAINREDSLLKVIRNQEEADLFMAHLRATIKLAQENR
jgi:hypothetical protein